MTKKAQEAYIRGFCKVAEAYRVDPKQLAKQASIMKRAQSPRRILNTLQQAWTMPLSELWSKTKLLDEALLRKTHKYYAQKGLGILPSIATRDIGHRTARIQGAMDSVLKARQGEPISESMAGVLREKLTGAKPFTYRFNKSERNAEWLRSLLDTF